MDKSKKGHSKLILACSDPAENFKFIEETLNMDFCNLSTMTYTDKLVVFSVYCPFFAPALCGCALMLVLSIHRFS